MTTSGTRPVPTLQAPLPLATPGPASLTVTAGPRGAWNRVDQMILSTFVVVVVLTQRIGIPLADTIIGVSLPLMYALAGILLIRRRLSFSRLRLELYLLAITACVATTAVICLIGSPVWLTSVQLLLVVYLPFVFRIPGSSGQGAVLAAGRTFVRVMLVVSVLGILQFLGQLSGAWQYEDYVKSWIPADLLLANFNTTLPLEYGSTTFKSNGLVLLEPSFLSQFCALAIIIGLVIRVRAWMLLILLAGMMSAVSGTGVILLIAGVLILLIRAPRQVRPGYVVAGAAALALVWLSPVAPLLLGRTGEVSQPGSSGYARFVHPYTEVIRGLGEDPLRYVTGGGPGSSERLLSSSRTGAGEVVLYSVIPKLAFEYGLIAGGLFILFLLFSILDGGPWRVVPGSLVVMTFVLSGGLLQPQTAALVWVFTALGSVDRRAVGERLRTRSRAVPKYVRHS